jgi:peptidoglycan/xylan/chitin deacetylase (PgdA/CDA1 family)
MAGDRMGPARIGRAIARRIVRRFRPRVQPAILMYHRVATDTFDPWELAVRPELFARQLAWLRSRRTVLPLAEFSRLHRAGELPAKAVAITFDDAYACVAEVAAPMLETAGVPATIFVPPELIERGQEFWWDDIQRMVLDAQATTVAVDGEAIELGRRSAEDRHWPPNEPPRTDRQKAFHAIWAKLRVKSPAELRAAVEQLRKNLGAPETPRASHRPMTVAEARAIRSANVHFGSHALTHPSLPCLDPAEKRHEILDSVAQCTALTKEKPTTMAYPYGDFDSESEELAAEAGFDCACTTEHAFVTAGSRPFALPRIQVGNWSPGRLRQVLEG